MGGMGVLGPPWFRRKYFLFQVKMPLPSIKRPMEFHSESCTYVYNKGFWFRFRFWFHRNFWVSVSVSPKPKNGFRSITKLNPPKF